jgi:hypothetical protein
MKLIPRLAPRPAQDRDTPEDQFRIYAVPVAVKCRTGSRNGQKSDPAGWTNTSAGLRGPREWFSNHSLEQQVK